jgi:hypothetical protein
MPDFEEQEMDMPVQGKQIYRTDDPIATEAPDKRNNYYKLTPGQEASLRSAFTYHAPAGNQAERYNVIRIAAYALAALIMQNTPVCPDQSVAIRKIREAVMTANAAIAINESSDL